jgi:hypothetical protein
VERRADRFEQRLRVVEISDGEPARDRERDDASATDALVQKWRAM